MSNPKPEPDAKPDTNPKLRQRYSLAPQSKGNLGKSHVLCLFAEFCVHNSIPFDAIDCDQAHHTVLDRYPNHATAFPLTQERDSFGRLLDPLPGAPVVIWDFPSNYTDYLLDHDGYYGVAETLQQAGARMTLFLFESDNTNAQDSAADLFDHFGESVDWILVSNPGSGAKPAEFRSIALYSVLMERKTPVLEVPPISVVSKNAWAALEAQTECFLPIGEVIKHPSVPFVARRELAKVRDIMFVQFEDMANLLVPDAGLIKNPTVRVAPAGASKPTNRFQNPLLTRK
jgi:hypothetical protein